jgi:lipopolysaccharide transport system ATP-binding protein
VDLVLEVQGVSKRFRTQRNRPATLKESVIQRLKGRHRTADGEHWALREISVSLEKGRSLGIIGHNGAGKSTLLRLICGLGRPTTGTIRYWGQIGSLLELGNGFQPEMTGRENLLTGGILGGLSRREVEAIQDDIIAFAELEEFIDQPVRTYSSGMYLRLAFATVTHFNPDFLIIDELLAVGDSRFHQKCLDRLKSFRIAGKSLLIVSHDLDQIRASCDEVLVLEEGRILMRGDPETAILAYYDVMRRRTEKRQGQIGVARQPIAPVEQGNRYGTQEATITAVSLFDGEDRLTDHIDAGSPLTVELEYLRENTVPDMACLVGIFNENYMKCFETFIPSVHAASGELSERGSIRCHLPEVPLVPARYYVAVGLFPTDWSFVYDHHEWMHTLHVMNEGGILADVSGVLMIRPEWTVRALDLDPHEQKKA